MKKGMGNKIISGIVIAFTIVTHWLFFYVIIINSFKTKAEASKLSLAFPSEWALWDNYQYVLSYKDFIFLRSMLNSLLITVATMLVLVLVSSMTGYVLVRRKSVITAIVDKLVLAGLIAPLSIIPTYWMLSKLHVANTVSGLVLVEIALMFSYATMLYKGYIAAIPKEIDEAAILDGCGPLNLFFRINFQLMKPITATVIILRAFVVYNDFSNPMYFLSGSKSATVQLCVYTFQTTYGTDWGHLFAAIVLVSLPPVILFIAMHKRIMDGMVMGAVKG